MKKYDHMRYKGTSWEDKIVNIQMTVFSGLDDCLTLLTGIEDYLLQNKLKSEQYEVFRNTYSSLDERYKGILKAKNWSALEDLSVEVAALQIKIYEYILDKGYKKVKPFIPGDLLSVRDMQNAVIKANKQKNR